MHPRRLFTEATSAAGVRTEGVVVALIEWWIDVAGGLADLEKVADQCSFQALDKKVSRPVYKIIGAQHDYKQDFLSACEKDPSVSFILKLVLGDETDKNHQQNLEWFNDKVNDRLPDAIVYRLMRDWWPKHSKRIAKERLDYKKVQGVMES